MQKNQNEHLTMSINKAAILLFGLLLSLFATAAPIDLATKPLSTVSADPIRPNLLFIFDDSGSMGAEYMPDWANDNWSFFTDASYNSVAYDPAIVYTPPVNFNTSGIDLNTYPSQIGTSTATGGSNWSQVKKDAYGILTTSKTNLTNLNGGAGPKFWTTIPGEFCKKADLKDCNTQSVPDYNTGYIIPAPIRWCNSSTNADRIATPNPAVGACQGVRQKGGTFDHLRAPSTVTASGVPISTITLTDTRYWWDWKVVNGITVNGQQIMRSSTNWSWSVDTIAARIADRINDCTNSAWGNCTFSGGQYAQAQGNIVTIYGVPSAAGFTPSVTVQGRISASATAFVIPPNIPGGRIETTIAPGNDYPYPGSTVKHGDRTDCISLSNNKCSYQEEMTNYANWYTYYRTRVQMMKSASSLAFKDIQSDFRVGYMTTSTLGGRSLDIKKFDIQHKASFYNKLFNTESDRWTPLRGSLSTAGRIFANKTTAHGTFTDPIEYECQENFALLTTDGFWNTNEETSQYAGGPKGLNGSNVGNQDSAASGTPFGKREGSPARSNTLADVAMYYRETDLRTSALNNCTGELGAGSNVCETPATTTTSQKNEKQTMRTFTLGLGVDGTLAFVSDYENEPGDYLDMKAGSSTTQWPDPINNGGPERIDDLWHAAVNGDGKYFSAKNPNEVVDQLKEAISAIRVKIGSGAAAATSSLNPVSGNNSAYLASYATEQWTGNLERRFINPDNGFIQSTTDMCVEDMINENACTAPASLVIDSVGSYSCVTANSDATSCASLGGTMDGTDCKVVVQPDCQGKLKDLIDDDKFDDTRNIKMKVTDSSTGKDVLGDFTFNNMVANLTTAQMTSFDQTFLKNNLTQWSSLTTNQQNNVTGAHLVEYLRGRKGYEMISSNNDDDKIFRKRLAVMGDIVSSKPAFMGAPTFSFGDSGYQTFKTNNAGRRKMVYVGANDGMLHAFDADTFEEVWAYVPTVVIPNMWKLADINYSNKHTYYVNGSVEISDICVASDCSTATASDWRTILVGGLNAGGRSYYALDITDPDNPELLWEFDASNTAKGDPDLGYTFGNPFITKRNKDDKWVVMFTSGYNNLRDDANFYNSTADFKPTVQFTSGDGKGYLYVLDANTGAELAKIATNVGSTSNPSGLGKITAYVDNAKKNNKTQNVYAGDLYGNLWRFDIDAETAFQVTSFGVSQPIMTRPVLGLVNGKRVVITGTGKYLERSDLLSSNFTTQSIYAIQDDNAIATLSSPRSTLIPRTIVTDSGDSSIRLSGATTTTTVDFDSDRGWYIDLPDSGERQNIDSHLILGTLIAPTIVTQSSACQPAGYGWLNYIDYKTGLQVNVNGGAANLSVMLSNPAAGVGFVVDTSGGVTVNVTDVAGGIDNKKPPTTGSISGFQMKRSIWREIIDE